MAKLKYEDYKRVKEDYTFHGTEAYHKFSLFPVLATDGAIWLAENFECFWLLEDMAAEMMQHNEETFWVMKITVKDNEADIRYEDGNYELIREKHINYTDMPEGEYELWGANHPGNRVILMNTEY